jgi:hypothetical protein
MKANKTVTDYLSGIGKTGGSKTSPNKALSSALNGKHSWKPHFTKLRHFLTLYPHPLLSNEYKIKFSLVIGGKKTTYNPDYFCPTTGFYIEVTTSKPNISEQGEKWAESIRLGHKLKVFWWEGEDITNQFLAS